MQTVGGLALAPAQEPRPNDVFGGRIAGPEISHLIFCGHSRCLVFDKLLHDLERHSELLLYRIAEPVLNRLQHDYQDRPVCEFSGIMIQEAVLLQAGLMQQRPDVAKRLNDRTLLLHIWIRDDETTKLAVFSPASGQFHFP